MKRFLPLVLLLLVLNCKKEDVVPKPIADFTTQEMTVGQIFTTNLSKNATHYQWDFGDGQVSTDKEPTPSFKKNGRYLITLTAKNDLGDQDRIQKNVDITSVPIRGEIMFWTGVNIGSVIEVSIQYAGTTIGYITQYQSSGTPSTCGTDGFFTMSLPEGLYSYSAKSTKYTWSGTFSTVNGTCRKLQLTI